MQNQVSLTFVYISLLILLSASFQNRISLHALVWSPQACLLLSAGDERFTLHKNVKTMKVEAAQETLFDELHWANINHLQTNYLLHLLHFMQQNEV